MIRRKQQSADVGDAAIEPVDRDTLDSVLRNSLSPLLLGLTVIYAILVAIKPWAAGNGFDSPPVIWWLMGWNAALAVLFFTSYTRFRQEQLPPSLAHAVTAGIALLVALDSSLHLVLLAQPIETVSFILIVLGISFFVTSMTWFVGLESAVFLVWAVSFSMLDAGIQMGVDFGVQMATAVALSSIAFVARRRTIQRLELLHEHEARTNIKLAKTLAKLQHSEERFRLFAENALDIIYRYRVHPHRGFEYVSPSAARASNRSIQAFYSNAEILREIVHPDDRQTLETSFGHAPPRPFLLRWRLADGTTAWMEHREVAVKDKSGRVVAVEGIARDVTEQKRAQDALRESRDGLTVLMTELQDANQELEAFSYTTSHDLKAPLRGIDVYSTALIEDYGVQMSPDARDLLERIRQESQRMTLLVNDLLTLSRVARGRIHRAPVDLSAQARQVVDQLRRVEPEREVEFVCPPTLNVNGDPTLMRALLENLIGNAWKFTRNTKGARIELGVTTDLPVQALFVRDNGIGFDMRQVDRLFRPFQRLTGAHDYEGSGIGLATVQRIVHRHGGTVWAKGAPNEGATFFFTLPDGNEDAQENPEGSAPTSQAR